MSPGTIQEFKSSPRKDINFQFTYAIGDASGKNGFNDDAGAAAADDAESKTAAIVYKVYHFNLSPFRIQLQKKKSQWDQKSVAFIKKLS